MIKAEAHTPFYRSRKMFVFMWCLLVLAAISLTIVCFWLVAPAHLVTTDEDTKTNQTVYEPGDFVMLTNPKFCNYGVDVTVSRRIQTIDEVTGAGGAILLPPLEFYENRKGKEFVVDGEPSDCTSTTTRLQIPMEVFPGRWRIINETTFKPNPVRTVTVKTYSNWFTVK